MPLLRRGVQRLRWAVALVLVAAASLGPRLAWAQGFDNAITFGDTGNDQGSAVAVAPNGDLVVTGTFRNTVDFDPGTGTENRTSVGSNDAFVARYSAAGAFVSVVTFGGTDTDVGRGVAVAPNGDAVVTGTFRNTVDFDPGAGDASRTSSGDIDVFVARYSAAGAFVSVATFGGTGTDQGFGVAVAPNGDAVATGTFAGIVDFDPGAGDASRASAGGTDAFVARYDAAGALVSVVALGSTGSDQGLGVAVDASGNAVVTGFFSGTVDFDPGTGTTSRPSAGSNDAFVARYASSGSILPVELAAFTATTSGRTARLSWTTASETNNVGFTVERQTGTAQAGTAWTDASAMIAGQGTTTERTDYAFDVTGLTAGRHTFRLRQSDTDGTVHYSAPVTVEIGTDGETVVTVLGNGTRRPVVRIEGAGAVRAEAYDVLGRRVSVLVDGEVAGTVEASLPVGVSSGAYVVRVVASGRATSHAVVVR